MKKNCDCSFLYGQLTDPETVKEIHSALQSKTAIQKEVICYKRDGKIIKLNSPYSVVFLQSWGFWIQLQPWRHLEADLHVEYV